MDKITHEVWRANWKSIIEQMSAADLPAAIPGAAVSFAEIPVQPPEDLTSSNLPFQRDAVIHFGKLKIGLSNSISDTLLRQMLEVIAHVS